MLFVVGLLLYGRRTAPNFFQWIFQLFFRGYILLNNFEELLWKNKLSKNNIFHIQEVESKNSLRKMKAKIASGFRTVVNKLWVDEILNGY